MNSNGIEEIISSMTSFSKERYYKNELLPEMFKLQGEVVKLAFGEDHPVMDDMRLWDVEKQLSKVNEQKGHIADEELERFKEDSHLLCNLIKAEVSGRNGENKVFSWLYWLERYHKVLRNVELSDGDLRTEIDALVINSGGISIVEAKNTSKDVFIDENGECFRTGVFLRRDCNLAEKMNIKESLVRKALNAAGIDNVDIKKIVVFTHRDIEVHNKYGAIETCFLTQLPSIIDNFGKKILDDTVSRDTEDIYQAVKNASVKEAYPFNYDVDKFKRDFAAVLTKLESAPFIEAEDTEETVLADEFVEPAFDDAHISNDEEQISDDEKIITDDEAKIFDDNKDALPLPGTWRKYGKTVAIAAVSLLAGIVSSSLIGKNGTRS